MHYVTIKGNLMKVNVDKDEDSLIPFTDLIPITTANTLQGHMTTGSRRYTERTTS